MGATRSPVSAGRERRTHQTLHIMEEKGCLLCHSLVTVHVPLDKTNILKIRATLPDLELKLFLDGAVICEECSRLLENYSKTISDWAKIEDSISSAGSASENINLEEVCCLKQYYEGKNNLKMCRLCLIPTLNFVVFTEERTKMWDTCLSGLNLKLTMNPVLCSSCDETLSAYYRFTVMCNSKEETLKSYIQTQELLPSNLLGVLKRMNNNWSLSDVRIENIVSLNEPETCSRYNTRKRKLLIEDIEDDDIFDDDDEDRDPDFVLGGSDNENTPECYQTKSSTRKRVLNRKYRMESCKYCRLEIESSLLQLHYYQCEMSPIKRERKLWVCRHCSLEDTNWNRLEGHLKSCDNYQVTLQEKQLEIANKGKPPADDSSPNNRKENLHTESGTSGSNNDIDARLQLTLSTPLTDSREEHLKLTISLTSRNNASLNGNNRSNELQIQGSGTVLSSSRDENLNVPTITTNLNTSCRDLLSTLTNNNNNNSGIIIDDDMRKSPEDHVDKDKSTKNTTSTGINILSNVLVSAQSDTTKTSKKFTETSQCLIVMKCTLCKFNTRCNDKLYKHVMTHLSSKCLDCDREIADKSYMYRHLTIEHKRDFTRWYYWCVSCVTLFRTRRSVEAHECVSDRRRVIFKSNGTVFCMLCQFESDELKESLDHQLACLKNPNNKNREFDAEVIEID